MSYILLAVFRIWIQIRIGSSFFADPDLGFKSPDPSINKKDGYDKVLEEPDQIPGTHITIIITNNNSIACELPAGKLKKSWAVSGPGNRINTKDNITV